MYRGYDSAGVHYAEVEILPDFNGINTLSTGIVGGALRGPTTLTRVTSVKQLKRIFGEPSKDDWGIFAALKVLKNSRSVYYKRVMSSQAAKGVAGIAGKTCKYLFTTKNFDEYLNGVKVQVVKTAGTTNVTRKELPQSTVTLTRPAPTYSAWTFAGLPDGATGALTWNGTAGKWVFSSDVTDEDVDVTGAADATSLTFSIQVEGDDESTETVSVTASREITSVLTDSLNLADGTYVKRVLRVFTQGDNARVFTPGYDYEVDFANGAIKWLSTAHFTPPAGSYYADVIVEKAEQVVTPDLYKVLVYRKGQIIESISHLTIGGVNPITSYGDASEYFDVTENPNFPTTPVGDTYHADLDGVYTVSGGNSGIRGLTADDYIGTPDTQEGMQAFLSAETVDISTLIVPGVSDDRVIAEGIRIAETRGDIMYIPEMPLGLTPIQADKFSRRQGDWTPTLQNGLHQINSKFAALYYPWVQEYVAETGRNEYTPASAWVASQWAYSDSISATWFAPAGFQDTYNGRGILSGALGVEHRCTVEERDLLYADDNGTVNPIAQFPGRGVVLWGNKTTLKTAEDAIADSSFTQISVRRMCNYIRKVVTRVSMETLFEPNKQKYRDIWVAKVEHWLELIRCADGIARYKVICDDTTVSEEDVYYGRMPGKIYVQPEHSIERIDITFTVTHDSVYFGDEQVVAEVA